MKEKEITVSDAPERRIRFTDSDRNALFDIPDGGAIVITRPDGGEETVSCRYVDENSFEGDGYPIRIVEFALMMEESGNLYGPEGGDAPDAYEIGCVRDGHYQKIHAGVLASNVTPEDIFRRHNESRRPCGPKLPPLSQGDIVTLNRRGQRRAFRLTRDGFAECQEFPKAPRRGGNFKKRKSPER